MPACNCYNLCFQTFWPPLPGSTFDLKLTELGMVAALLLALTGCGGGPSTTSNTANNPGVKLKQRAFIANQHPIGGIPNGEVLIADAEKDQFVFVVGVSGTPTL